MKHEMHVPLCRSDITGRIWTEGETSGKLA